MKRGIIAVFVWSIPLILPAQAENSGISWTLGLSLEQVRQKARQEGKYIFLDCFTTWCGPCKWMDRQVYNSKDVGQLFNEKFINVKVQMDKTNGDNEEIKRQYKDADMVGKLYHIEGYPTFLFLSPDGALVNKDIGAKDVNAFISIANTALLPGRKFDDPYASYDSLIAKYKSGKRDFDDYPLMITIAGKKKQLDIQAKLFKELTDYLGTVEKDKRYTKERIEMWDQFTFSSNSQTFQWLYKDAKMINAIVIKEYKRGYLKSLTFTKKGWAETMVDRTIQAEIVAPFFAEQNKNSKIAMSGMYLYYPSSKSLKTDSSEADWKELTIRIKKKYGSDYAERNVRIARIEWYVRHFNYGASAPVALEYLNKDFNLQHDNPYTANNYAFNAFDYSNDMKIIKGYIKWMQLILETRITDNFHCLDTYANLLYKAGQKKEAIALEERAVKLCLDDQAEYFMKVLETMKKDKPTWKTDIK